MASPWRDRTLFDRRLVGLFVLLFGVVSVASCVRKQKVEEEDTVEIGQGQGDGVEPGSDAGATPADDVAGDVPPPARAPPCVELDVHDGADAGPATAVDSQSGELDVAPVSCSPGEAHCEGMKLATCTPAGDGWHLSYCFPGNHCSDGVCTPIANNLIIVFDTSGSMGQPLPGKTCKPTLWPKCESPSDPCTRMGLSKQVFGKALSKLNNKNSRLALFRFPQISSTNLTNCNNGLYEARPAISGDKGEHTIAADNSWYWSSLGQVLCVDFPLKVTDDPKKSIALWMDGVEVKGSNPELRTTGGTPIGNTLFYVSEYIRHRVIIDGRKCASDADCDNPNYNCQGGKCVDPARACRETAIILYTDGGQFSDPSEFRSPRVQAKRLAFGLGCESTADCVGGAVCYKGHCRAPNTPCNICFPQGQACDASVTDNLDPLYCPIQPPLTPDLPSCIPDPISEQQFTSNVPGGNVLRSPDGKPFGVRLHVVDISGTSQQLLSFALAKAGNGQLLAADAADPDKFLSTLEKALDLKNQKVCGVTY